MITTDICIIGAGPVGLFSVFEAGLLKMRCHLIDALPQIGGQLSEIYPKKPIYDIPGFPEIKAEQLVENLRQQILPFNPTFTLGERVEKLTQTEAGEFIMTTSDDTQIKSKVIVIAGGLGCFEPRKPELKQLEYFEGKGFDKIEIAQGHLSADAFARFAAGKKLMEKSDCKACHAIDRKSVGPMYLDVAKKYKDDPKAIDYLAKKIISGGSGVWGEVAMSAHPQMSQDDATEIVKYVLSLGDDKQVKSLPPAGAYTAKIAKGESDKGVFIIRAAYTDRGANGIEPATAEKVLMLKSPNFAASTADKLEAIQKFRIQNRGMEYMIGTRNNAHIGFSRIDMSGIDRAICTVYAPVARLNAAGGSIEVRIDAPDGPVIGSSKAFEAVKSEGPAPQPIIVPIKFKPTPGHHDLYFIYQNEKAPEGQSLFILVNIELQADGKGVNAISMN